MLELWLLFLRKSLKSRLMPYMQMKKTSKKRVSCHLWCFTNKRPAFVSRTSNQRLSSRVERVVYRGEMCFICNFVAKFAMILLVFSSFVTQAAPSRPRPHPSWESEPPESSPGCWYAPDAGVHAGERVERVSCVWARCNSRRGPLRLKKAP